MSCFCYSYVMVQSTLAKKNYRVRVILAWLNHNIAISNVFDIWRDLRLYHNKNNSVCRWILSGLHSPEAKFKLNWTKGVSSLKFFLWRDILTRHWNSQDYNPFGWRAFSFPHFLMLIIRVVTLCIFLFEYTYFLVFGYDWYFMLSLFKFLRKYDNIKIA